jgi:hypothetical protein
MHLLMTAESFLRQRGSEERSKWPDPKRMIYMKIGANTAMRDGWIYHVMESQYR